MGKSYNIESGSLFAYLIKRKKGGILDVYIAKQTEKWCKN